ncbi:MAG: hypothetical protein IAE91_03050 [Ignavibacteriaceae bacterium]|nr:hypothetical protein [Ignavibacteriaceae bacterium]
MSYFYCSSFNLTPETSNNFKSGFSNEITHLLNGISLNTSGSNVYRWANNSGNRGAILVGLPLIVDNSGVNTPYANKIEMLDNPEEYFKKYQGHFIVIYWDEQFLTIISDPLGLRDFYLKVTGENFELSTSPQKLEKSLELDFEQFGGRWLLINQVSYGSIFKRLERICCGAGIKIDLRKNEISKFKVSLFNDFDFSENNANVEQFKEKLQGLLNACSAPFNLSLSGGLDSRLLLSLSNKSSNLYLHSFGKNSEKDVIIASQIAEKLQIYHEVLNHSFSSVEEEVNFFKESSKFHLFTQPFFPVLRLANYNLVSHNGLIADGGFGELWRREFLNRVYYKSMLSPGKKIANLLNESMVFNRVDIFDSGVVHEMQKGASNQIEEVLTNFSGKISLSDKLDLLSLMCRLPNLYAAEQTRLDSTGKTAFMPYVQRDLLKLLFTVPKNRRKNGKLFKQIINSENRFLAEFPLAKNDILVPFNYGSLRSRIYRKIKNRTQRNNREIEFKLDYFLRNEDYLRSEVFQRATGFSGFYNKEKISKIFSGFYAGNYQLINEFEWFISFELTRQKLGI